MESKLLQFRTYSKKFILGWCFLVLLSVSFFNFSSIFQKGPEPLLAQEDQYAPGDIITEDYAPGTIQTEEFGYAPGAIQTNDYAPGTVQWDIPVNSQPQSGSVQEPTVIDTYPECAGGTGVVHTVDKMSDGTYRPKNDDHFQSGVCGDSSNQQPQAQQFQPETSQQLTQQSPPTVVRTYSECSGGVGRVHQVDQMSDGTYRTYNEHTQSGACGDDGRDRDGGSVVRTYSECAGSPGMVRDVEQLSNGGYRTFNEHYQAGACGDQRQNTPVPTATPNPTYYTDYRCEGTTKVYYNIYSDGRNEPSGARDQNSYTCGFQASASSFHPSHFQGAALNNFFRPSPSTQYPALSASCIGSPSQTTVNQSMSWRAMTTGGSGSFDYHWSGDQVDGQTGSNIFVTYQTSGNRTVQVVVKDSVTGNSVSAACSINIMNASQNPTPTPTPMTQVVTTNQPNVQCPSGTIERSRNGLQLVCEKLSPTITTVTANNSAQCPAGTIEKSRNNNEIICERQNGVSVAVIAPSPSPAAVQCPSGTIERSRTAAELICERQSANTNSQVFNTTSSNSQTKESLTVLTQGDTSIKELPKTGLPLAAIGLASLMPIGLRAKKMLGINVVEENANLIWTNRELKK